MSKMELIFDFDYVKYTLAAAAEKRDILVTHPSGIEEIFKNRTEFYGHHLTKSGGWLKAYNERTKQELSADEFTIFDLQHPEPLEFCLSSVKSHIYNICDKLNVSTYRGFVGRGDSFRKNISTVLEYKGNRNNLIKPVHLKAVEEYLIEHHDAEIVTELEADDKVIMTCWKDPSKIAVIAEKDYYGVNDLNLYNVNTQKLENTGKGLGELYTTPQGVKGIGRKFFYHQVLSGDSIDNYKANSASDIKWGEKSSFNALKDCESDKACFQALIKCYKTLYPEPKEITGWRGDAIKIDWKYMLEENWQLAKMWRYENDNESFFSVATKLGIEDE